MLQPLRPASGGPVNKSPVLGSYSGEYELYSGEYELYSGEYELYSGEYELYSGKYKPYSGESGLKSIGFKPKTKERGRYAACGWRY